MTNISAFVHNGITVKLDQDFINLTKLWEMAGRPESQTPAKWRSLPSTDTLISQILDNKGLQDNIRLLDVFKVTRGRNGKTLAHWKLALDYAGYLSPALKSQFYDWIRERIEEESNPELAYKRGRERVVERWQKQGHGAKHAMNLQPYATSFYGVVTQHFNAGLTIIECEQIVAFKLEYLDSLATPSITYEKQNIESLFEYLGVFITASQKTFLTECSKNPLLFEEIQLIFSFPFVWGIKPKDPLLLNAVTGCHDAKSILRKTGRIRTV